MEQKLKIRLCRINLFLETVDGVEYDMYNKRSHGINIATGERIESTPYKELKKQLEAERDEIIRKLEELQKSSI
jgi:hypothetical protein